MINPWRKIKGRVIYENPWIKLEEHQVVNPSGGNSIYGKVFFKNKAVGVLPIDEHGNIILVGQYRYTIDEYSWEIPEGGSPQGENPLETAKRELQEETGFTAESWQFLCRLHTSNSVTDEEGFLYLAEDLTPGESSPEETEDITIRRVTAEEALAMVLNGEITDSLSQIAIMHYFHRLNDL